MTTRRTLFAAALLLMGAALWTSCQKEADSVRDGAPADIPEGSLWLSLEANKADDTKALVLDGSTLNAYWVQDEPVKVFLNGTCIGTLYAAPNGTDPTKATLSGTVDASGIAENAVLTLLFPRESWDYAGQAGTLASIAANYDYAAAEVEVVSVDGNNVTTTQASFVNQQSIYKLTFSGLLAGIASVTIHSAGNKLVASSVVGGSQTYGDVTVTLDDAARTANGDGVVYAALRFDALEAGQTDVLTITITDTGSNTYVATKFSPSGGFQNGKYYTSTKGVQIQRTIVLDSVTEIDVNDQLFVAAQDGDIITGDFDGYITVPDGATVTLDDANITAPDESDHAAIHCLGSAHIILNGVNNAGAGFYSNYPAVLAAHNGSGEEYTLTISGTGSLNADSSTNSAGIGGGNGIPCGNIVITGGTIDATVASFYSAGIGSGQNSSCGDITISGGTVTATGSSNSAGIGSGDNSTCGNITISGGRVEANGGNNGAGIGSGRAQGSGKSSCGDITISGGEVIATGAGAAYSPQSAAGIGSGHAMSSSTSSCGDITISGGTVTATGSSNAAGIGCGYAQGNGSISSCEDITISGGVVTATGGTNGAGIGSGYSYTSTSRNFCGAITISGGTVTATGSSNAAGIGSGHATSSSTSFCGDITISGGSIGDRDNPQSGAIGGEYAAGIGSGYKGSCGNITITEDIDFLHAVKNEGPYYESICIIGYGYSGTCGIVTIAGIEITDDNQKKYGIEGSIGVLNSYGDPNGGSTDNCVWALDSL